MVQCRTNSTRLRNKCFLPLKGKPLIKCLIERLEMAEKADNIYVLFPDAPTNNPLEDFLKKNNTSYFRGSEENVLERYQDAAREFKSEIVVRVTGDNPFICPEHIDLLIDAHINNNAEYTYSEGLPLGCGGEVVNAKLLLNLSKYQLEERHREHVTLYIRENADKFKVQGVKAKKNVTRPDMRLTVDEKMDYKVAEAIYEAFPNEYIKLEDVIYFLDEHPNIALLNKEVKQKNPMSNSKSYC